MRALKNSGDSRVSSAQPAGGVVRDGKGAQPAGGVVRDGKSALGLAAAILIAAAIAFGAARWSLAHGYVLYFGDAEAHFNIARRILDSRTPGPEQIGTVWLPLPHLLLIPFVMHADWWHTGLAGVIPSAACFAISSIFLFLAARRVFDSQPAAFAAILVFALNPNMLYLSTTPMTEPVFAASIMALLYAVVWFRDSQSIWAILLAAAASNAASQTRYEGWFLIPFVALYLLFSAKKKWHAILFGALASLAPITWLAHNRFYNGDALEFYRGQWSALAIYQRQIAQGMARYPGDHDWPKALQYFSEAVRLVVGWPTIAMGTVGLFVAVWKKVWWPIFLLALSPIFYIWSMHSSGTPIFVPTLWPHSFYNTRYALAALPLCAFAAGALVLLIPNGRALWRWLAAAFVVIAPAVAWNLNREPAVTWKESEVNSVARRAWTHEAAKFLQANYQPGDGLIFPFGDMTGILREAGIPLREGLHEGNGPPWELAVTKPDYFLRSQWAIAFSGDRIATAILRARKHGPYYELRKQIILKGAPVVEIYQRTRSALRPPCNLSETEGCILSDSETK